jgi:GNAT superfamily N-acetyltransferase
MGGPVIAQGESRPDWMVEGGFELRPVRASDRNEVLAMTAHTWEDGDYIPDVFDMWLADPQGLFAALVHTPSGRIAAIDKVSILATGQAWFEGLRVNPDFRGQGISGKLQTHMVGVVRAMGAGVVRFITLATNIPIHIAAYRDGFHVVALTRYWRWKARAEYAEYPGDVAPMPLRPAHLDEAPALHDWWHRTAAYPVVGLLHRRWTFYQGGPDEWIAAAREGRLLVEASANLQDAKVAPAAVMLNAGTDDGDSWWSVAATLAGPGQWAPLYRAMLDEAGRRGVAEVDGLFADIHDANEGLKAAGLQPDPDDERLYVFELRLDDTSPGPASA